MPHIIITGGSSGIGEALARHYAAQGWRVGLTGRDAARLAAVAEACRALGAAAVTAEVVEVTDKAAMEAWLLAQDAACPVDLLVANAGISGGTSGEGESAAQAEAIFRVNLDGVLYTLHPLIPRFRARKSGQIALISSLAGFRGLPGAPAYSASKMAVRGYGEALRGALAKDGVKVSVVCPGWVESRITAANDFPMPGILPAPAAAERIAQGLAKNRARITFPKGLGLLTWFLGALPPCLTDPLYARLPTKAIAENAAS